MQFQLKQLPSSSEHEAREPVRSLEQIVMPKKVRAQVEAMENVILKAGKLQEPVVVLVGLDLSGLDAETRTQEQVLRRLFPAGSVVVLQGFLSGSIILEPPVYAAGKKPVMMEISCTFRSTHVANRAKRRRDTIFCCPATQGGIVAQGPEKKDITETQRAIPFLLFQSVCNKSNRDQCI